MNPLTQIKWIQNINAKESDLGISEDASWHAKYKNSAYIYVGGLGITISMNRKMKRRDGRTERHVVCAELFREESLLVEILANFPTMRKASNTGWGHEEDRSSKWDHDKFNGAKKGGGTSFGHRGDFKPDAEEKTYRGKGHVDASYGRPKEREREERQPRSRDSYDRREQKRSGRLDDSQYRRHDAEND